MFCEDFGRFTADALGPGLAELFAGGCAPCTRDIPGCTLQTRPRRKVTSIGGSLRKSLQISWWCRGLCVCSRSQRIHPRSPIDVAVLGNPGWVCSRYHKRRPWRWPNTSAARVWGFDTSTRSEKNRTKIHLQKYTWQTPPPKIRSAVSYLSAGDG